MFSLNFAFACTEPKIEKNLVMNLKLQILLVFCYVIQINSQDLVLSSSTNPVSYTLFITTNVPQANRRFTGVLNLKIRVDKDTKEIYLHSRGHTIIEYQLFEVSKPGSVLPGINFERVSDDVILFTSEENLQAGFVYDLNMSYQGNLLLVADGFFRSDYVVNESGSDVFM